MGRAGNATQRLQALNKISKQLQNCRVQAGHPGESCRHVGLLFCTPLPVHKLLHEAILNRRLRAALAVLHNQNAPTIPHTLLVRSAGFLRFRAIYSFLLRTSVPPSMTLRASQTAQQPRHSQQQASDRSRKAAAWWQRLAGCFAPSHKQTATEREDAQQWARHCSKAMPAQLPETVRRLDD